MPKRRVTCFPRMGAFATRPAIGGNGAGGRTKRRLANEGGERWALTVVVNPLQFGGTVKRFTNAYPRFLENGRRVFCPGTPGVRAGLQGEWGPENLRHDRSVFARSLPSFKTLEGKSRPRPFFHRRLWGRSSRIMPHSFSERRLFRLRWIFSNLLDRWRPQGLRDSICFQEPILLRCYGARGDGLAFLRANQYGKTEKSKQAAKFLHKALLLGCGQMHQQSREENCRSLF